MSMTLGDGFNRRKKLDADINAWTRRLAEAGANRREYFTEAIEGEKAFRPTPGSEKSTERHYTIEECREKLKSLIQEDQALALRISKTNQVAAASVRDLEGNEKRLTVPELLVLKNDVIPKLEAAARAVPLRAEGVNVFEQGDGLVKHRIIKKQERKKETLVEKGMKLEELVIIGYEVYETTDYGIPKREAWNEVDRIQEFAERVKQAVAEANKTELLPI
jgi:hypothetical protein